MYVQLGHYLFAVSVVPLVICASRACSAQIAAQSDPTTLTLQIGPHICDTSHKSAQFIFCLLT